MNNDEPIKINSKIVIGDTVSNFSRSEGPIISRIIRSPSGGSVGLINQINSQEIPVALISIILNY